jgi:hypothetical protein
VKKSKVLGTFRLKPCKSPWTLRMTHAAVVDLAHDLALLHASNATFFSGRLY